MAPPSRRTIPKIRPLQLTFERLLNHPELLKPVGDNIMSKTDRALKIAIVALGSMLAVAIAAHAATHVAAIWGLTRTHLPLLIDIAESSQLVCHWSLRLTIGVSVLSLLTMRWRRLFAAVVVLVVGIALMWCSYNFLERHPNENHVFEAVVHSGGEIEVFGRRFGIRDFSLYDLMRRANANNLILQMYDGTPQAVVDVRCDIPVEDLFDLTAPFYGIALMEYPTCSIEDLSNLDVLIGSNRPWKSARRLTEQLQMPLR